MKSLGYNVANAQPVVKCKAFEDNSGALALANAPAMRPRTKHIGNKYHHFRQHVHDGTVGIEKVESDQQQADMLTKQSTTDLFCKHRKSMMGW